MMIKVGFSESWTKFIMLCVKSTIYSIMINGEPKGCIKPSRGLLFWKTSPKKERTHKIRLLRFLLDPKNNFWEKMIWANQNPKKHVIKKFKYSSINDCGTTYFCKLKEPGKEINGIFEDLDNEQLNQHVSFLSQDMQR